MNRYKANKDVYCPHTGRHLFHGGDTYDDISETDGDIILRTNCLCEVSKYTITGEHCNLEGFFDKVVDRLFSRTFSNRKGGIGDLTITGDRFIKSVVDITFTSPYHEGSSQFFASMGAADCDNLCTFFFDMAQWIREGE